MGLLRRGRGRRGPPHEGGRPGPFRRPHQDFGSNQARQAEVAPQAVQAQPVAEQAAQAPETQEQAAAQGEHLAIYSTLRQGSKGAEVEILQRFLGLTGDAVDGKFGSGTKELVQAWQAKNKLTPDGVVGTGTVAAMRGDTQIYGYSRYQHPDKFVPAFPMMAYHESGQYRTQDDPYAVGAQTNPNKSDDLGGKTYGTYQFESFVYANGENAGDRSVAGSTVMRFINWDKNPYGTKLAAVVKAHGVASKEFDAAWKALAASDNKAFGKAQQDFVKHDKGDKVQAWMKRAAISSTVAADNSFFDLVLGTLNHVGTLADSAADHVAALRKSKGRDLTVNEAAVALTEYKSTKVSTWFRSSPGAHQGIKNRFRDEKNAFQ